jgi:hypothetical protein
MFDPGETREPATGDWEMIVPGGIELLGFRSTSPLDRPADDRLLMAWATESPMTLGTVAFLAVMGIVVPVVARP